MILTENSSKWSQIIKEELGVENPQKLNWMSQYARNHEVFEGLQTGAVDGGIYSTPLNTLGMGNPGLPLGVGYNATSGAGIGNSGADFHSPAYKVGSGDSLPMSTLPIALNVAAMTIALELVPVIQSNGPWYMLSYMDFPYAGGKLARFNETAMDGKGPGAHNKPIYIKVSGSRSVLRDVKAAALKVGDAVAFKSTVGVVAGKFMGFSRIDNNIIIEVKYVDSQLGSADGSADLSIADVFEGVADTEPGTVTFGKLNVAGSEFDGATFELSKDGSIVRPDFVATMTDHLPEFGNFFDGSKDGMTRAQNETGVGNTIGARMFTKLVQMRAEEVTGSVTRQQLQDMPLYGVDVIGKVLEAMQNEISQTINKQILDRLFKLGVTNAVEIFDAQGANLNLYVSAKADATKDIPAGLMVGVDEVDYAKDFGKLANAAHNTSAENITTWQRRIMSRVLAASNLIAQVGRRGRANWVVTNTQVISALQDAANFVVAPMVNTLAQDGSQSLYFAGSQNHPVK